jgi:ATPase subunit of ABC transporter with duplicated ATPase domains
MASWQYVYQMNGLSKTYSGGRKVLDDIHLSFFPDAKIGILGVNGAGKSTLMRIMAGIDKEFTGEAFAANGARVGYLPQEPQLDEKKSVRENVMEGVAGKRAILERYNELASNYSDETADEMAKLQDEIEAKGLWDLDSKIDQAMDALRCPPDDENVTKLSGGERRRVALCRLLLDQPDLLLLDEPTNHLDAETVAWLENHLKEYPGAVLIVTHDRYFLDNVTGWILELDRGRGIPYQGNYSSWLEQKQKRLEQEGREEEARQRAIEREREWISASPKARQAKNKARFQRYEDLVKKSSEKAPQTAQIIIPVAERLGSNVIDADGLAKAYGDNLLFEKLDFKLPPGGIVGVIGANVLLLDEPTNDLDVDTLRALEEALEDFAGCAVIISHDRFFLDRIATHMLAFEGESHVEWFEGNFQDYEPDKKRILGAAAEFPHRIKYKKFTR